MVILMVLGFMLAWTPYAVVAFWIFTNKGADFTATLMAVPAFFSKSSSLYNPIIYVLMNKQVSCPMPRTVTLYLGLPRVTAGTFPLPASDSGQLGGCQHRSASPLAPVPPFSVFLPPSVPQLHDHHNLLRQEPLWG